MEKKDKHRIDRREFLKRLGAGTAAVSAMTVAGCSFRDAGTEGSAQGEVPTDKMTYRTDPKTGEQISLLGYGCMRWPMMPSPDGNGEVINQETVNRLVDYALAHGVNYFDTAPPYCRGLSEKATGTALKRHPRNSYYLATKMSNHRLAGQELSPEELFDASVKMYRRAFLVGYDRSVPKLRQADHCIGCDQCVHHCPQSINIPAQMQRINFFVEQLKQETL